ncbi:MAG TPA: hypothetical protein VGC97_00070 [Pyrinomonadaceae bacterium]|jgi:hypothetical protein
MKKKITPVSPVMTEAEIKEFVKSLLTEADYHHYALDGFIFLFKTFSEMAENNTVGIIDLLADLQRFIYTETVHCSFSEDKYKASIHERYRQTDYTEKSVDIYKALEKEFEETAKPLDLSGSSVEDLSVKLSEIMHNPNLPARLHDCLGDELANITGGQIGELINSPEMIAKALKNQSQ